MAPPKLDRKCSIAGCGRKHAAHGYCLMHYKRIRRHGSPEYRWGGKIIGRSCLYCERPVAARDLCDRHYQMLKRHGDPLYADRKKAASMPNGSHMRRGYRMITPIADQSVTPPANHPTIEKTSKPHARLTRTTHGFRDGSKRSRREWEHRKIAGAKPGEIVHHIDLDPTNNTPLNLHVFISPAAHAQAHRSLEKVAAQLVHSGLVIFDRHAGIYLLR